MGSGGSRFYFYSSVTDARGQKKQHDEGFSEEEEEWKWYLLSWRFLSKREVEKFSSGTLWWVLLCDELVGF